MREVPGRKEGARLGTMSVMVDSVTRFDEIEEPDDVPSRAIMYMYDVAMTVKKADVMYNGEMK